MKPHKHAEILHAIAEGKEVEYSPMNGSECWYSPAVSGINPIANFNMQWRIKLEPKPDAIKTAHILLNIKGDIWQDIRSVPNVRFTFDGETGKLKSAEVLSA